MQDLFYDSASEVFINIFPIRSFPVSIYVVFVVAFMAPQTVTETVSNITPTIFHQLHLEYSKTLSCPCSTTSVPYKTFVFNTIKFHPICSSFFISRQWIDALYLPTANDYDVLDFRKTAHSQVRKHPYFT